MAGGEKRDGVQEERQIHCEDGWPPSQPERPKFQPHRSETTDETKRRRIDSSPGKRPNGSMDLAEQNQVPRSGAKVRVRFSIANLSGNALASVIQTDTMQNVLAVSGQGRNLPDLSLLY